jgi:hypothetical protein
LLLADESSLKKKRFNRDRRLLPNRIKGWPIKKEFARVCQENMGFGGENAEV